MKKLKAILCKSVTAAFLLTGIHFIASAQKLSNKQDVSLFAPANVKIDGNTTEWGDKFQAYNTATQIYYTIANDDANLFLIVRASDIDNANKIIRGGITLTVDVNGKKNFKNSPSVTFPKYEKEGQIIILEDAPQKFADTLKKKFVYDSIAKVRNRSISEKINLIVLTNLKGIEDNVLSVNNDKDLKIAIKFSSRLDFI